MALPQPGMFQKWQDWASALLMALLADVAGTEDSVAVVNRRLHGPAHVPNAAAVVYTSPTKTKTVIRQIWVSNPTGGAVNFTLAVGADAAANRLYDAFPVPTLSIEHREVEIPLEAGEVLRATASAATSLVLVLAGTTEVQRA
jgi:hypothetical protein